MKKNITGLILAGGKARRMGGIDKGLVKIKSQYLISYVLARIKSQVGCLMINTNRNVDIYQTLSKHVIQDFTDQRLGPLAGIQAGLYNCDTPYLIAIPCDVPKIPLDVCEKLYKKLLYENADCAMPVTIDNAGIKRTHPAILLLKSDLIDSLDCFLDSGGRKIDHWTNQLNCTEVLFKNVENFININKLEDMEKI